MWSVRHGRLYCGAEPVAVRRVVVELVAGPREGPVDPAKARTMIRMERALSLRSLSRHITGDDAPAVL
jgi:hypothetical protein